MNEIEKLLTLDASKVSELPTKEIKAKRLSRALGSDYKITIRAIRGIDFSEIQRSAINISKKGGFTGLDLAKQKIQILLKGIVKPDLKDKTLLNHFGVAVPSELIDKLFDAGEQQDISTQIEMISGFQKDDDADGEGLDIVSTAKN